MDPFVLGDGIGYLRVACRLGVLESQEIPADQLPSILGVTSDDIADLVSRNVLPVRGGTTTLGAVEDLYAHLFLSAQSAGTGF